MKLTALVMFLILIAVIGPFVPTTFSAQHLSKVDRELYQAILQNVASDVRKYYYDPKLHGVDWDKKVSEAKGRIAISTSIDEAVLAIAAVFEALDDSHTNFSPPSDPISQEYGWRSKMVGNRCFVTNVEPRSDAESKGLKPGDEILTIEGFTPTREALGKIEYILNTLIPQSIIRLDLRTPSGKLTHAVVKARIRQRTAVTDVGDLTGRDSWRLRLEREDEQHLMRLRFKELANGVLIVKLPIFFLTDSAIQEMIDKARRNNTLILDLRGNPGGAESNLEDLLGGVFEKEVKIADRVMRESKKPLIAKANHKPFTGRLIVLVDSESASASELFSRVVQIEKRGTVLGDRTSGSVMESKFYRHETGVNPVFYYGISVSEADLIMTDGKSLEHIGVTPDEVVLPTASDIAAKRDPVLARAADLARLSITPEEAWTFFPYEWPKH